VIAASWPADDPTPNIDFSKLEVHVSECSFSSRDTHEQRAKKTQLLELYRTVTKHRCIVERIRSVESAARTIMSTGVASMHQAFDEIASAATSNLASFHASSLAEQHCATSSATSAIQHSWLTFIVDSVRELLELKREDCMQPDSLVSASSPATALPAGNQAENLTGEIPSNAAFQPMHAAYDSTTSGSKEMTINQDSSHTQLVMPSVESSQMQEAAAASIDAAGIVDAPIACHICQRLLKSAALTQGISTNGCQHQFCRACLRKQYRVDFTDVSWRIINWPCPVCSRNCSVRSLFMFMSFCCTFSLVHSTPRPD
jgi:hypothetical protein